MGVHHGFFITRLQKEGFGRQKIKTAEGGIELESTGTKESAELVNRCGGSILTRNRNCRVLGY